MESRRWETIQNSKRKWLRFKQLQKMYWCPDVSKNVSIFFLPKELNKKINPINFTIMNIEDKENGALVIQKFWIKTRIPMKEISNHLMAIAQFEIASDFKNAKLILECPETHRFTCDFRFSHLRKKDMFLCFKNKNQN